MPQCPRCGAALPADAYYEPLPGVAPGRLPAYRLRHKRANGGVCVAYAGPLVQDAPPPPGERPLTSLYEAVKGRTKGK